MERTNRGVVFPWQCDHYGHLNVRYYTHFFDDASFHIWSLIGLKMAQIHERGVHPVVAEIRVCFCTSSGPAPWSSSRAGSPGSAPRAPLTASSSTTSTRGTVRDPGLGRGVLRSGGARLGAHPRRHPRPDRRQSDRGRRGRGIAPAASATAQALASRLHGGDEERMTFAASPRAWIGVHSSYSSSRLEDRISPEGGDPRPGDTRVQRTNRDRSPVAPALVQFRQNLVQ